MKLFSQKQLSSYWIILILFFYANKVESQTNIPISRASYAEKIYIQLSSTLVTTDEILWFKCIVANSLNHAPSEVSKVLYVELVDFDERVVDQKKLKLTEGISDSFFELKSSYAPGYYLIRAYTEWNKNFGQDFIFSEYINLQATKNRFKEEGPIRNIALIETEKKDSLQLTATLFPKIINPQFKRKLKLFINIDDKKDSVLIRKNKEGLYKLNYMVSKDAYQAKMKLALKGIKVKNLKVKFVNSYSKTVVISPNKLDLQFFPEGGQSINGLVSTVAFKAINYKNKGVFVSGEIVNEKNEVITAFKSNQLGMGAVEIKGDAFNQYYGKVTVLDGTVYKYKLPKTLKSGYNLTVKQTADLIKAVVRSTLKNKKFIYVGIESRGARYKYLKIDLKEKGALLNIDKHFLPEGIVKITVFDEFETPVCERLLFNTLENTRIQSKIVSARPNYSQRDKVKLEIQTKNANQLPVPANISVLVLNKNQLGGMHKEQATILSHFLLNSELKGVIEQPNYYFTQSNMNRFNDLDKLMLTQGWRSYKYNINTTSTNFRYRPEKGLRLSGSFGEFYNNKRKGKKEVKLTLITFDKEAKGFYTKKMDSTGKFTFNIVDSYSDEVGILMKIKDEKGNKLNYTLNIDKRDPPEIVYRSLNKTHLPDTLIKRYIEKRIEKLEAEKAFQIPDNTIQLGEVKVSGKYKLTPEREKMKELHGEPDIVIENKELSEEGTRSSGLFKVLRSSFPDDVRIRSNGDFMYANAIGADFTFIIIDGIPVNIEDYQFIERLPIQEIKSVEVIKRPKNPRKYEIEVFGKSALAPMSVISFINIYTHSKNGLFGVEGAKGLFRPIIKGFTPHREFYAPKYNDLISDDWKIPDFRSVTYWNPNITTNEKGEATVEYYNGDDIGDRILIIEAIAPDGKIGYNELTYTVEKRMEK